MNRARELAHAERFGVETTSGRVGCVAAVMPRAAGGGVLLVHTGGRSCALTSVPFADVRDVDLGSRRIVLSGRPGAGCTTSTPIDPP